MEITDETNENGTQFATAEFAGNFYDLSLDQKLEIGRKVNGKYGGGFKYIGADTAYGKVKMLYMKKNNQKT